MSLSVLKEVNLDKKRPGDEEKYGPGGGIAVLSNADMEIGRGGSNLFFLHRLVLPTKRDKSIIHGLSLG